MKCPRCQNLETKVIDSRDIESNKSIRRRRQCLSCESRFTTFERIGFTELMVIKKDKTQELYNREKLKKSLMLACAKRETISIQDISNIISNVEIKRLEQGNKVSSQQIGEDIMEELKKLDVVAFMRFASVYKSIETKKGFLDLLQ